MKIIIDGKSITRDIPQPTAEEATYVIDKLKDVFGLTWSQLAIVFGMENTKGNIMNMKYWCNGKKAMPLVHYITALELLDELNISVVKINDV